MDLVNDIIVDINADMGEGIGNEAQLMPYISSCNIACGGHAGDGSTMNEVVALAKQHQVKIGAHPSFPDKVNFGRHPMAISHIELFKSLIDQIQSLQMIAEKHHIRLHHVKPHGALYNLATTNTDMAQLVIEVLNAVDISLKLYAPYQSVLAKMATDANIEVSFEAFADRNYNADLTLVNRGEAKALILNKANIAQRVYKMINQQKVEAISGGTISIKAHTFCVHGDTENAVEIARYLNEFLKLKHIKIR